MSIPLTLAATQRALHDKTISCVELTQHYLARIDALNPDLNAYITVSHDHALKQAHAADAKIAAGQASPLTGIPIAWKDIFCTKGILTSCASKMLADFIAPYSAHAVKNYDAEGAIMLGKTNLDEFAMGAANEFSYYGPCKNPWNTDYIPGGSSGGSAVAVAAGLAVGATGTDTGGSIRQPAALCGLTGIKPTYGRISRFGMVAFASSLDQGGPMARSAEDCAIMLDGLSGFDPQDSTSLPDAKGSFTDELNAPLKGKKIGIVPELLDQIDADAQARFEATRETMTQLGCTFVDVACPNFAHGVSAYYIIAPAECSSNLARYDGVRYGYRCDQPTDLEDLYCRSRAEGLGEEVKRRILIGTHVLSSGYYDAFYTKAQKVRTLIREDFIQAFEKVDAIMTPTYPSTARKIGDNHDPMKMYLGDCFTLPANMAGLPGISMPVEPINGLPFGIQFIGPALSEASLLNIVHQYQQQTDWHLMLSPAQKR